MPESENFLRLLFGAGENNADIRYASKFGAPDAFLYFECGGRRCVVLSKLEIDRGRQCCPPEVTVLPLEKYLGTGRRAHRAGISEVIAALAAECGVTEIRVAPDFPLGTADKLRAAGLTVTVTDGEFFPQRRCKSAAEIADITVSQRAGEAGLARALAVLAEAEIRPDKRLFWQGEPLTSEILRAEIDCTMLRRGMLITGTICAGGRQGAAPHCTGSGQLWADTPVVMDIFPRSAATGYWGDLTRTVVKGRAPAVVREAYAAVLEAREYAKSLIRPGASAVEIHRAANAVLEKHGFTTGSGAAGEYGFFHGLGHGVGLEIHEAPRLSLSGKGELQSGEVVTVEPGLYYPEWGGIRLEDLMVVAEPAVCLTQAPDMLEIE